MCKALAKDAINKELIGQFIRASSSVGANYREASNAMSKKDFYHRIGICRKEAKEARYWLELLLHSSPGLSEEIGPLIDESLQLTKIFSSIAINRS